MVGEGGELAVGADLEEGGDAVVGEGLGGVAEADRAAGLVDPVLRASDLAVTGRPVRVETSGIAGGRCSRAAATWRGTRRASAPPAASGRRG